VTSTRKRRSDRPHQDEEADAKAGGEREEDTTRKRRKKKKGGLGKIVVVRRNNSSDHGSSPLPGCKTRSLPPNELRKEASSSVTERFNLWKKGYKGKKR